MTATSPENPYAPPGASPPPLLPVPRQFTSASIVMLVVAWVFWGLLLLGYPVDYMGAALQKPPVTPKTYPNAAFINILRVAGAVGLVMVFFFRWLFFSFLIHPKRLRPGSWAGSLIGLLGALMIFGLIKGVEVFGFMLWLQYPDWGLYWSFMIPSLICCLLVIPARMIRRKSTCPINPPLPSDGRLS